jgi:hypothetical protein
MTKARVLCAVLPDSIIKQDNVLESLHDVTYVTTLDDARAVLAASNFDLIVCGVHFDGCQMPLLLQHCKTDPRLKDIPFVGFRAHRGRLPESIYAQVRKTTTLLGGVYVDLIHWIDSRGRERALLDFQGVIASRLREATPD